MPKHTIHVIVVCKKKKTFQKCLEIRLVDSLRMPEMLTQTETAFQTKAIKAVEGDRLCPAVPYLSISVTLLERLCVHTGWFNPGNGAFGVFNLETPKTYSHSPSLTFQAKRNGVPVL